MPYQQWLDERPSGKFPASLLYALKKEQLGLRIAFLQSGSKHQHGWVRWAAIACVLLLVLAATVQIAHSHPLTRTADHCSICLALHSALPAEVTHAVCPHGFTGQGTLPYVPLAPARCWNHSLAIRPPPTA